MCCCCCCCCCCCYCCCWLLFCYCHCWCSCSYCCCCCLPCCPVVVYLLLLFTFVVLLSLFTCCCCLPLLSCCCCLPCCPVVVVVVVVYLCCPQLWHGVVVEAVEHGLESLRHDHQPLQSLLQILQWRVDHSKQSIVPNHLHKSINWTQWNVCLAPWKLRKVWDQTLFRLVHLTHYKIAMNIWISFNWAFGLVKFRIKKVRISEDELDFFLQQKFLLKFFFTFP